MTAVVERHDPYSSAFEDFRRDPAFGPEWLQRGRELALQRFLHAGFPTTRDEDWRFTNVAPIADVPFARAVVAGPDRRAIEPYLFREIACQIVLVNGRVSKALSSFDALPAGVRVRTMAELVSDPTALSMNGASGMPFADLNHAFFEDALIIDVAPRAVVELPVHVIAMTVQDGRPLMTLPRLVISVAEGGQLSLVETYGTAGEAVSLTSAVMSVTLAQGAVLRHVKLQRESKSSFHIARIDVRLGRSSVFEQTSVTLGGRISRNDIVTTLDGEGAECTLNGLYIADGDRLVDTHTTIDHAKPHCPSHEVYKGILAGKARAVFNGKIIVRQDAQKTNAKQTNKALLLSDDATINTKPQLEIFADDVKCTHGAAIGQLDEDAMFYLRARGIAEHDARNLLIHAFAGEVLAGIPIEAVRTRTMRLIDEQLSLVPAL